MPDILHRVGIQVPADKVFTAINSIDGLAHWWVIETKGDTQVGGVIDFGFCQMRVVQALPGQLVQWECIAGPEEWLGTKVSFALQFKEGETFVLFKHADWKEPVEFMHHCSTKWATFLLSLKYWLERSEGRPAPYNVKLSARD